MYANIVVLTYQSPEIDFYTYEIPKELVDKIQSGQLVSVPFGIRNPLGMIISLNSRPGVATTTIGSKDSIASLQNDKKIQIKSISSIILEKPILLPYQLKLLNWMSQYYLAPMSNCLEAMLPKLPNVKRLTPNANTSYQPPVTSYQTLVLAPSINHIPQVMSQFPVAKSHIIYTNELKTSERFITWQKILSGHYDFIFGSRSAVFAPCPNLKKIIIFDEHENTFKDDRSPYFDTLTVAEKISELTKSDLEIIDSTPKITTYFNHNQEIKIPKREVQTKIISLTNERKQGNYSPISLALEEIIKRAYAKKLSILLFMNKKIESGSIYCRICKHQEFAKSQPDNCVNCGSEEIFFNSTNINSLAKEIKKILPEGQIGIIAEGVKQSTNDSEQLTIDITTSSVFYKLLSKKYDLVAHVYTDSPLNFNEYNATEEIFSQITNLKKLTKKLLVVQTYNEDLPAIKFAATNSFPAFYKSELNQRKILSYPPFALLVKIMVTGKKEDPTEQKAEDYKNKLEKLPTTHYPLPTTILGPYKPAFSNSLSYNITLKIQLLNYSLKSREAALKKIHPLISREKNVRIIVEPKNLNS